MSITQFTMEEVRCFSERQTLEIRPLTFLVGENSTGKTTALSCFHVLANYLSGGEVDFNQSPYLMGTFKNILRNSKKKEQIFKLGFVYKYANQTVESTVEFVEKSSGIEPAVNSVTVKFTDGEIIFKTGSNKGVITHLVDFGEKQNQYQIDCETGILDRFPYPFFFDNLRIPTIVDGRSEAEIALGRYLVKRGDFGVAEHQPWNMWKVMSVFSPAPIRALPKRTYDPTREFDDPEGGDRPMYLMRIEANQKEDWEALKSQLVEFGKSSGLFQSIKIKKLGQSSGAPFQLQFKVRGPICNITDIGYGVSQILPILIHILNSDTSKSPSRPLRFSLLQQPEIHLHPKAQAEFSSLLTKLASKEDRLFIVETHSDYMLDRARIEIRKGTIRPEDVSLIYFEPKGNIVRVHNIHFDKMGNMEGVPPHYRNFFLKESKRLMGFED